MIDLHEVLMNHGEDSILELISCNRERLILVASIDVLMEKHTITIPLPQYIDVCPLTHFTSIRFGALDLLPFNYLRSRQKEFADGEVGSDEKYYRVVKIVDQYGNNFFIIFIGSEAFDDQTSEFALQQTLEVELGVDFLSQ